MYIRQTVYTKFINKPYNNTFSMFLLNTTNLIYDMYIQQTVYTKFINKPYINTFSMFLWKHLNPDDKIQSRQQAPTVVLK